MSLEQVSTDYEGVVDRHVAAVLADRRRRRVLSILANTPGTVREEALAWAVTAETYDEGPAGVDENDHRETRIALHHRDLPKLSGADLVDRDRDARMVDVTETGDRVAEKLEADDDAWAIRAAQRDERSVAVLETAATCDDPTPLRTLAGAVVDEHDEWDDP